MKVVGLLLPGLWHIFQGRYREGLILFAIFFFGLNAFLVWPLAIGGAAGVRYLLLVIAVAAWLFSTQGMFRRPAAPSPEPEKSPSEGNA